MKFNLICSDPAWSLSDPLSMSEVKRSADSQYSTMTIDDIKALRVPELVADDAMLALWVPSSLLQEGLDVMKAWGFRHTQTHIWNKIKKEPFKDLFHDIKKVIKSTDDKTEILNKTEDLFNNFDFNSILSFGMGRLFRQTHEIVLIGVKGKIYNHLKNKSQRSVHFAPNYKHSQKPESLQESLELMFPEFNGKMLEMFARRDRPGWVCLGNECPSTFGLDIRDCISKLIDS